MVARRAPWRTYVSARGRRHPVRPQPAGRDLATVWPFLTLWGRQRVGPNCAPNTRTDSSREDHAAVPPATASGAPGVSGAPGPGPGPGPARSNLFGWSFGGLVAYVVVRLEAVSEEVVLLARLDSHPLPEGFRASTTIGADGTGLTVTRLADKFGSFGHGMQTLLVSPLPGPEGGYSGLVPAPLRAVIFRRKRTL